jgi:hypothetical protein
MTTKLKNRIQKMKFQKVTERKTEIEDSKDTHIWDEILRKRTMELIGKAA